MRKTFLLVLSVVLLGMFLSACTRVGSRTEQDGATPSQSSQSLETVRRGQHVGSDDIEVTKQTGTLSMQASGRQSQSDTIVYENHEYGFRFFLPKTWEGYTVVTEQWEGFVLGPQGDRLVQTGPRILIRHPRWTRERPRQDIPVMVFTVAQWDSLQKGEYHVSAAPVGPIELGRNNRYVFALPPRYNYAFSEGWEEAEEILRQKPLQGLNI